MVPDGAGGLTEQSIRKPVWFDAVADGGTPMCRAASEAQRVLGSWIAEHPDSFPPTCIHITDGEATDGNPTERLNALKSLSTSDGNAMLFNIHLSANPNATPVLFPDSPDDLPDAYSKMLFDTASPLTPSMRALAKEHGFDTSEDSRCFVLNADLVLLVQAIDIGTRPSNVQMDGLLQETEAAGGDEDEPDTVSEAEEADDEEPDEPDTVSEAAEADDEEPEEPDTVSEAEEADDEEPDEPDTVSKAEEADDEKPEEPDTVSEAEEADDEKPEEPDTVSEAEGADDEEMEEPEPAWSGRDQEIR